MKRFSFLGVLLFGAILFVSCAGPQKTSKKLIGCQDVSLRKDCVNQAPKPLDGPQYSTQQPFTSQKLPRSYPGAPPQIPHSTEGLSITAADNSCLGCHFPGGDPIPALPASHLQEPVVVLDHTSKPQTTRVTGFVKLEGTYDQSRYFCVQCHVPQATNLKPLVKNNF